MTVELAISDPDSALMVDDARTADERYCPDVYFTAGYGSSAATMESGTWHALSWRDTIRIPYVLRRVDATTYDAVSPYGYCGIGVSADCTAGELARFWDLAVAHWRAEGVVSVFLRFSPLDPGSVAAVAALGAVDMTRRGDTVVIDVRDSPAASWGALEPSCRNKVRKAEKAGLTARVRPAGETDIATGSAFRTLYEATMRRVGSTPGYLFADDYYTALARGVSAGLHLAEVHDPDGTVVASSIILAHGPRVHYHLAGSAPEAIRRGGNNLLLWTLLNWAHGRDAHLVHLGGGLTSDDSLFAFKKSFGGRRGQFWTGAAILDPARYGALVTARATELGQTRGELEASGYFPAYRSGSHALGRVSCDSEKA